MVMIALLAQEAGASSAQVAEAIDAKEVQPPAMDSLQLASEQEEPSILKTIADALRHQLHVQKYQWCNALGAFVLGMVLVIDGEFVFKWVVMLTIGLISMLLALNEVTVALGPAYQHTVRRIIGLEVFAVSTFAAYKGIDGVMIMIAALFGLSVAHFGLSVAHRAETILQVGHLSGQPLACLKTVWYTMIVVGFMFVAHQKKYKQLLAFIAPALGGILVSSAVSWLFTLLAVNGCMTWLEPHPPVPGAWVDFLSLLMHSTSMDVGVFANAKFENFQGRFCLDRVCGWTFWFILFAVGTIYQRRTLKKFKIEQAKKSKSKVKAGRSNLQALQKPILKDEV